MARKSDEIQITVSYVETPDAALRWGRALAILARIRRRVELENAARAEHEDKAE